MDINFPPKVRMIIRMSEEDKLKTIAFAEQENLTVDALVKQALGFYQSIRSQVHDNEGWRLEVKLVDEEGNEVSKISREFRK